MKTSKTASRRKFLLAAGLGGAGAAAAVVSATSKVKEGGAQLPAVDQPSGYRLSAHIEKYYKTTEV